MLQQGQCFIAKLSERETKGYFFTGLYDGGKLVMCEMVNRPEQITRGSYMLVSEDEFNEAVKAGRIELI